MDSKQKKGDVQALERRSATYEGPALHELFFDHVQKTVLDLVQNGDEVTSILDVVMELVGSHGRLRNGGQKYACSVLTQQKE